MSDPSGFQPAPSSHYRLYLRVTVKLLLSAAVIAFIYVFASAFLTRDGNEAAVADQRVVLTGLASGATMTLLWDTRPVIVHRRTPDEQLAITQGYRDFVDPQSSASQQPSWAQTEFRSRNPEWFVAIALGTDFSCSIAWLPPGGTFRDNPWRGGFKDSCRGSRYDPAGRVYSGQYASRNLIVPDYRIDGDTLILGAR